MNVPNHTRRVAHHLVAFVAAALLSAGVPTSVRASTSSEAGSDGDHIYAGITYDSESSFARCEWSLPLPSYGLGSRIGATTREWNGITWVLHQCTIDGEAQLVWLPQVTEESFAETTRDVVRDRVPMLDSLFSPHPARGLVKTPVWFWVPASLWRPVSVTARVPTPRGVITLTTTATPDALEFDPGDGTNRTTSCDGPGLAWTPAQPERPAPACSYEYPRASSTQPGGVFRARLTVVWRVTWRSNLGASGRLPDMRLGGGVAVRVRELQAVVVR
jgi:hypothetical protein